MILDNPKQRLNTNYPFEPYILFYFKKYTFIPLYLLSILHMASSQPEIQLLVTGEKTGVVVNNSESFGEKIKDLLTSIFFTSSQSLVSNLISILLVIGGVILLFTLYKNLKRIIDFIRSLWVQSEPNEWLVVIRNGNFVKAGVGLKTFIGPWDSVVRYPSRVQRISFLANNVTLQMQGMNINGVAFWSVYRFEQGPFKCYKYMQGGDPSQNVKTMCESILRNLIANSKLDDVLKKRDFMRDTMKKELQKPLKGWGIWLESVEITQVRICSNTLFEELQADFRNATKIHAKKSEFQAQQKINQQSQKAVLMIAQLKQENETKKDQQALAQQLERIKQRNKYDEENNKFELQRMERNKKLELQKLRIAHEQETERIQNELRIQNQKDTFEEEKIKRKIELDSLYTGASLQKYSIDTMERIYRQIGVREMRINQFSGNEQSDLGRLLPTLGMINSLHASNQ